MDPLREAFFLQLFTAGGRAPALPHNRVVNRLACFLVPNDDRFALIGDADRGDLGRGDLLESFL